LFSRVMTPTFLGHPGPKCMDAGVPSAGAPARGFIG